MKKDKAPAPAGDLDWETLGREKREKIARRALKEHDVDALVGLTLHNLLAYGRGGAHTSPHTMRGYTTGVRQFLAYALPLGWRRMLDTDTDLTIGYIRHLEREGVKAGTINSRRSAARALYRALRWARVISFDPFSDTPRAQDHEDRWAKREAYSREDIDKLLSIASPDERRMILLGAHGALRMSELTSLTWEQVDLERRVMTITGKGRKTALVNLSGPLTDALAQVPKERRQGRVLPWHNPKSIRFLLRGLCHDAGVDYTKRQVHGLRHAAATMLLDQCGDIVVVARHLRHSSVSTTEAYSKLNPKKVVAALAGFDEPAGPLRGGKTEHAG